MSKGDAFRTAVIYARFSCSKQREASIEDQLRVCSEWCDREGYAVVGKYCDYAVSGRTDDRPQFQRMIANAGESDVVVVYMMDRFSRDPFDAPIYKRELAKRGVRLVSALESIPDSPEGIIYEKLLEGLAACESLKTSARVRRGMEGNALKCMTNGVRVWGYREGPDGRYVVDEDEAAFVREAFERKIRGEAANSIARDFAQRGVRSRAGAPCGYSMVHTMLHNRKYTGRYEWGGQVVEGGMPAIVDEETFMAAQVAPSKRDIPHEDWADYTLSGRVICSGCGRNMPGCSGWGHKGVKYTYYRCTHCRKSSVRCDWLEGEIVAALRALLKDPEQARRIAEEACAEGEDEEVKRMRRDAERSLRDADRGIANLLRAVEQGIIVPGTSERVEQLQAQKARAERDLKRIRDAAFDPELFAEFLQCEPAIEDRALVDAFVYQVVVYDDSAIVTLNFDINDEPARFEVGRVRKNCEWWAQQDSNLQHRDYESPALTVAP